MREAAEAARRERRASLGLDELKTPDDFVCPITYEVMRSGMRVGRTVGRARDRGGGAAGAARRPQ